MKHWPCYLCWVEMNEISDYLVSKYQGVKMLDPKKNNRRKIPVSARCCFSNGSPQETNSALSVESQQVKHPYKEEHNSPSKNRVIMLVVFIIQGVASKYVFFEKKGSFPTDVYAGKFKFSFDCMPHRSFHNFEASKSVIRRFRSIQISLISWTTKEKKKYCIISETNKKISKLVQFFV